MIRVSRFLVLLGFLGLPLSAQAPRLHITYLANMGVLLEGGGKRVVIDGLHHGELAEYASVPPAMLDALEKARAPFQQLDLMLTTHRHRDHFNATAVAARLLADSVVLFLAARETVDSLHARSAVAFAARRLLAIEPPPHGAVRRTLSGIAVEVLDLPHNPTPSARVANVGFLVTVGEQRVLHVGDADPTVANFAPHRLAERGIDVAIVPFWYLTDRNDAVRRAIGARRWIATHIPPADAEAIRRQVLEVVPGAVVLIAPGERHSLP